MSLFRTFENCSKYPFYFGSHELRTCVYAREYTSRGGYQASDTNSLISNLKIQPGETHRLKHKRKAIQKFADELAELCGNNVIEIANMPTSKKIGDPEYDNRLDEVLRQLSIKKPNIRPYHQLIVPIETKKPAHTEGDRDPDVIYPNLKWKGNAYQPPNQFVLFDDVITTGGHFIACKRLINENWPRTQVFGVFWAKTIWDHTTDFSDVE